MKTAYVFLIALLLLGLRTAVAVEDTEQTGEILFKKNCSSCHPEGGNLLNKEKTLSRKDRERNKVITAEDIIKKMRNPSAFDVHPNQLSGMKVFDERKLSDSDARKIAEYILETFK